MLRVKTATHRSPEARRKTISIFIFPGFYFIFIISCDTTMVKVQTDWENFFLSGFGQNHKFIFPYLYILDCVWTQNQALWPQDSSNIHGWCVFIPSTDWPAVLRRLKGVTRVCAWAASIGHIHGAPESWGSTFNTPSSRMPKNQLRVSPAGKWASCHLWHGVSLLFGY